MANAKNHIHWKRMINTDYLGAYSLDDGCDMVLTIRSVGRELVTSTGGKKEECVVAHFFEDVKPMILNRTNLKMIQKIYSTPFIDEWVGRKIQVYQDKTRFGGDIVECLRIRPSVPHQAPALKCAACGSEIRPANGMSSEQVAKYTAGKYGAQLCAACAAQKARTAAKDAAEKPVEKPVEKPDKKPVEKPVENAAEGSAEA